MYNTMMIFANRAWNSIDGRKSEQDLYSVLSPITTICQVFGIFPSSLKGPTGKRKYSTNYKLIFYGMMTLALSITGLFRWTTYIMETVPEHWNRTVTMISIHIEFILQSGSMIVTILSAIINRDKFTDAIDTLSSQDKELRELGARLDYTADFKRHSIRLGRNIFAMTIIITHQFIFQIDFNSKYPLIWAVWIFSNLIRVISTWLFGDVLFALKQRFNALNEQLAKLIGETHNFEPISQSNSSSERLCSIARIHGILCEVASNVTKMFGFNTIIGVVCALKVLTSSLYHVTREITGQVDISWMYIAGIFNWGMISSAHIVYLVTVCNLAKNQANLTGKLIHKIPIHENSPSINAALRSFSLQLYHERIEFTAAGVFPLDATLLQNIVAAVTTFLIFVLQFN